MRAHLLKLLGLVAFENQKVNIKNPQESRYMEVKFRHKLKRRNLWSSYFDIFSYINNFKYSDFEQKLTFV